jgi:UDP-N-acetylmuramyl pentapeptide phosphotransferase/UDP-N-acetylglucosamine-1-phosphate transferase
VVPLEAQRMMPIAPALIAALGCAAVLWLMLRFYAARLPLDHPNTRSLHDKPIPRIGGVGVLAGVALAGAAGTAPFAPVFAIALILAGISFIDDLHRLPVTLRLAAHLGAAAITVWYVLSPMNVFELALLALAVAWLTNLYNFMDGSDGLAAGMAIIGFGTYAMAAWWGGDAELAPFCSALAGAALGFLAFNFHPARAFLGDVGSIPLGFLAGALGIVGWRNDLWPLWFPVLVFAPFIADATMTLIRRAWRRERIWKAHREHYYQRLVQMGWGHRGTAYAAYALMAACGTGALFGRDQPLAVQLGVLAAALVMLAGVAIWIDWRWSRHGYRGAR